MRSGRTFFVLLTVLSFALLSGQPALAAAGTLDCRFGNNFGLASAMPSGVSGFQGGKAIAMYAGGTYADQLVMAGMSGNYPAQNGIVARFTADGLLDTTFNTTGFSAVFDSGGDDIFMAVAAQDDGKIMVAGQAKATGDTYNKILVARYTSDGTLDTSFSGDGWLTEAIGSSDSFWYDVVTDASGNIFVAGRSTVNPVGSWNHLATIVKYNSSGVRQAIWTYDLGTGVGNGNEGFYQIVPAGSGRFYAAGFSYNGTWDQNAIVYINSDGTLNTAFDGDGKKTFILSGVGSEYLYALGLQSDGKIVAAGTADTDSNPIAYTWTSFTVRLNADGTFDTGFSGDGKDLFSSGSAFDRVRDLIVQSDGLITVLGETGYNFFVWRYQSTGTLDGNFGVGGKVYVDFENNGFDQPYGIFQQSSGKLVAGGLASVNSTSVMGMVRLLYDDPNMYYGTTRLTQSEVSAVTLGSINQQIMHAEVCMNGVVAPLDLKDLTFNTTGSTVATDIAKARIFYTPDSTFATTAQYGGDTVNPNGAFTITSTRTLTNGVNHFWLAYDISPTGGAGTNVVDAGLDSLTLSDTAIPVSVSPSTATGSRPLIYADNMYFWITKVALNTLSNPSGADSGGWGNYITKTTTLTPGQSYSLTVEMQFSGFIGEYVSAFFDWNGDSDYVDANEEFQLWVNVGDGGSGNPFTETNSINIPVPGDATVGATHFLVVADYAMAPTSTINGSGYGEAELYSLQIAGSNVQITGNTVLSGTVLSYVDNGAQSVTADSVGAYTLTVAAPWTGVVTPTLAGYTFAPATRSYIAISTNQISQDFTVASCTPQTTGTLNWSVAFNQCPSGAKKIIPNGLTVVLDSDVSFDGDLEIQSGGTLTPNGKTVSLTGSAAQTLTGNPLTFYNLVISKTNASDTATIVGKLKVSKKLTITKGKLKSASEYGDVEIATEGTLEQLDDAIVHGDWINDGTFIANTYTVTFATSATLNYQSLGGTSVTQFNRWVISPTAQVFISRTPTVTDSVINNGTLSQTLSVGTNSTVNFLQISTNKYQGVDITTDGTTDLGEVSVAIRGNATQCTSDPADVYRNRCFRVNAQYPGTVAMVFYSTLAEDDITSDSVYQYYPNLTMWIDLNTACGATLACTAADPDLLGGNNYFLIGDVDSLPNAVTLNTLDAKAAPDTSAQGWLLALLGTFALGGLRLMRKIARD